MLPLLPEYSQLMIRLFFSLIRQLLFWILFFAFNRAVFLLYYSGLVRLEKPGFGEVMSGFWHALRLDVSTASYLLIIPFLLTFLKAVTLRKWPDLLNKIYTAVLIITYSLITTAELGIYEEWKTKLHYKALHYLSHPEEVYNSASSGTFFWLVSIFIVLVFAGNWLYNRYFYRISLPRRPAIAALIIFFILAPGLLFLGIRGGLQAIPITQSQSYYSNHNILNLAAVNSGYSFTFSMIENYRFMDHNPYQFYDDKEAETLVDEIRYVKKDTTVNVLNTARPNIVIILLESWSADLIHSLGGEPGITPEFEKLSDDGILFTQLYASGNRSEQAMSALFGGFPSTPITAITHSLEKVTKLPSLPEKLKAVGYHTSFYFGGHLMYGGIKSYLSIAGFEHMVEIYDLPDSLPRGKLGVHDEFMFAYQARDLDHETPPFLSVIFTLSSHSPYDQPMRKVLNWGGSENQYINSAYYTDSCLGAYFRNIRSKEWFDNTLFVIVADHSHNSYRHWSVISPEYRHIPLLLYGNVIKEAYRGTTYDRLASQTDIPSTLLKQLGLENKEFEWSRDLFNPYVPEYIFYEATNGVGWIRPYGHFVWHKDLGYREMDVPEDKKEGLVREGKAYLQVLFKEFIDY